jgi:uncharacterized repeat protein (TIGR03833 family)
MGLGYFIPTSNNGHGVFWYNKFRKNMDGQKRENIKLGQCVAIIQKQDQGSGRLTEGIVKDILTNSPTHPHGIKVRLETGEVGRVK